jgi:transposase
MIVVVRRGELTETAWMRIEPLLPQVDDRGRRWRDHRQVVNGILHGPWQTCYERYKRWDEDGTVGPAAGGDAGQR